MSGSSLLNQSEAMFGHTRHLLVYGEWISQRPMRSSFEEIRDLVKNDSIVHVLDLQEITGRDANTICKALFHLGYLMLATGEALLDSTWEYAPEEHKQVYLRPGRKTTRTRRPTTRRPQTWQPPALPTSAPTEASGSNIVEVPPVTVTENVTPVIIETEPEPALVRFHPRQIRGVWGVLDTERHLFSADEEDTTGDRARTDAEFLNEHRLTEAGIRDFGDDWVDPASIGQHRGEAEPVEAEPPTPEIDDQEWGDPIHVHRLDLAALPADTTIGQLLDSAAVLRMTVRAVLVPVLE